MTRLLRPRAAAAVLGIVLAVCVLFSTVGNAAGLSLVGISGGLLAQTDARCTHGTLSVSPSGAPTGGQYTQVTVTGDLGACAGGNVSVYLSASPNTVLFSGSGTVTGGSMTVTSSAFTPPASADGDVVVGLDGWLVPAQWSFTPPVSVPAVSCRIPSNPAIPCTATLSGTTQWPSPVTHWQRYVTVATTHPTPVVWEATINLTDPVFPVFANRLQDLQGGLILVGASACGSSPRTVTVRGTTSWGDYHQVYAGKTSQFQVEGSNTGGAGNLLTCP